MAAAPDAAFLRQVLLFRDVDEDNLKELWSRLRERRLRRGEVLFRAGDAGEELFVIRSGTVVVSKHVMGRVEQVLSRLGPGDVFGEMSVFGDERRRTATITAETDAVLLSLHRDSLNQFIDSNPRDAAKFFQQMVQVLIKRLADSSELVKEVTRWGLEATGLDVEHT